MDFRKELQRINKLIEDMPMQEFENMMFDCGLGEILPSGESEFAKCFKQNFFEANQNYIYKNRIFSQEIYREFNDFSFDGQGVA